MIELDFYIYVFSMELRSFEKPYVDLLNSSNWATGFTIPIPKENSVSIFGIKLWREPLKKLAGAPFFPRRGGLGSLFYTSPSF
jgi:hypothetical protein